MKKLQNVRVLDYLIVQCEKPTGIVGNIMTGIWNKTFIDMAKWGLSHTTISKHDRVLEIGCGGGAFINYLAKEKQATDITGIDVSEKSIEKAKHLNKLFLEKYHLSFSCQAAENLNSNGKKFNKIFAIQTHMYWTDFEKAIKNVNQLMLTDGEFHIICEKDKISYHLPEYAEAKAMVSLLKKLGFKNVTIYERQNWIHYKCLK